MRKALAVSLFLLAGCGMALAQGAPPAGAPRQPPMGLTSSSFTDGGVIPDKYTQNSPNPVSPALAWTNAPAGTQSFAIIMHDPDTAPGKSPIDILHWMAFNIPATVSELPRGASGNAIPDGAVELKNDAGSVGYVGAAPPPGHGPHHYYTVVHAVDVERLDVPAEGSNAFLGFNLFSHTLGRAMIVPTYEVRA